jgi:hypothetical protein
MPPSRVSSHLDILRLPEPVQLMFASLLLAVGAVSALLKVTDEEALRPIATLSVGRGVKYIEALVNAKIGGRRKGRKPSAHPRPAQIVSRSKVIAALTQQGPRTFNVDSLLSTLDRVCCQCGMAGDRRTLEALCNSCPLMVYLNLLAKHEG